MKKDPGKKAGSSPALGAGELEASNVDFVKGVAGAGAEFARL